MKCVFLRYQKLVKAIEVCKSDVADVIEEENEREGSNALQYFKDKYSLGGGKLPLSSILKTIKI